MNSLAETIVKDLQSRYAIEEYPCLMHQIESWSQTRPLEGALVLDATPIFTNTLLKYAALVAGGARVHLAEPLVMPHDPVALTMARHYGFSLILPNECLTAYDVVMDCAGYLSQVPARHGYVELTKSGERSYQDAKQSVWMVDAGRIKQIETCLGTGESFFRAMDQLQHTHWDQGELTVIGYGKVGRGIVWEARRRGVIVNVVDVQERPVPEGVRLILSDQSELILEAFRRSYAVVTATGIKHAVAQLLKAECYVDLPVLLANMGVEDEWDSAVGEDRVLHGKRPLNFLLDDPTLMRFIDPPLALHNEGARLLVQGILTTPGIVIPSDACEEAYLNRIRRQGLISEDLLAYLL